MQTPSFEPRFPAQRHARLAAALGVAASVTVLLLYPYLLAIFPRLAHTPIPLAVLAPLQAIQGGLQIFGLAWIGLRVGASLGLDAPWLRACVYGTPSPRHAAFGRAIAIGLIVGAIVAVTDRQVFMPAQPEAIRALAGGIARWKGLLASFYGGISEEIVTRLFAMTLLAWLATRLFGAKRRVAFIGAAILAAAIFAAAHLPAAQALAPLTIPVVVRVMVLNIAVGIPCGLLFWLHGLEHAMLAHFAADLILHVLAP